MYCQKCRTPLRLDGSLQELNPSAFKLLTESTGTSNLTHQPASPAVYSRARQEEYDRVAQNAKSPIFRKNTLPGRSGSGKDNPAMSFVMLSDSQMAETTTSPTKASTQPKPSSTTALQKPAGQRHERSRPSQVDMSLSSQMETANRLWEILSARSDIDHPICTECTELLLDELQKRLNNAVRERDSYIEFLRRANADVPTAEEVESAKSELASLRAKETAAFSELEELEKEKAALDAELAALETESLALTDKEADFWAERNAFFAELSQLNKERDALAQRAEHDSRQLQRLQRANIYNDAFSIGHDGFFGTINGLRLGRLPDRGVEWAEINAAWGQTCLLLQTVADKLGFKFDGYELVPLGSVSKIRQITYPPTPASTSSRQQQQQDGGTTRPSLHDSGLSSTSPGQPSSSSPAAPARGTPKIRTYDLFTTSNPGPSDFPLHIPLPTLSPRKYDTATAGVLACLAQLLRHAGSHSFPPVGGPGQTTGPGAGTGGGATTPAPTPTPARPPIPPLTIPDAKVAASLAIEKDRIGGSSIRLGGGGVGGLGGLVGQTTAAREEEWTNACKGLLIGCKVLLAFASNVGEGGPVS